MYPTVQCDLNDGQRVLGRLAMPGHMKDLSEKISDWRYSMQQEVM